MPNTSFLMDIIANDIMRLLIRFLSICKQMSLQNAIGQLMQKIKFFLNYLFNLVLLSAVYFFGIGPTAIVSRVFNKKFLDGVSSKSKKSNFVISNSQSNLEKMF